MALQGSIVITAKVDSGDASKQLQDLIGRIEALEGEQAKAARAAANHADKLERLRGVSQAAANTMAVVAAGLAAAGIASVKLAANLEQSRVAFTTLLGSAEKADAFLRDLAKFAASTPFEFVGLQDSARRLLAFGFAAQDIIPLMNSIGNAVAGLGGGKEQIDRVTLALGQMQAKGKVSAEEMNQLAEMGIPGWKMIASAIGVSIPEAMKMAEKGAIDSTTAINALINGMNEKFPDMMKKQSTTLNGVFSNLVDGATLTATLIGQKLVSAFHITEAVGAAASAVSGFAQMVKTGKLGEALEAIFPPGLRAVLIGVAGAITASLVPALGTLAVSFGAASVAAAPFLAIGAGIGAAAYLIMQNWEPVSAFFYGLFENIAKMADAFRDRIVNALGGAAAQFGGSGRAAIRLSQGGASIAMPKPEKAVASGGFKNLLDQFIPNFQKIMNQTVSTVANTTFTGLSGKPAGAGGPTSEEIKKAEKDAEHRKKLIADYVAWQAKQDRDADERSRKLTSEYIAWQAKQDRDDDERRKKLKTDYVAWQAKQDRDADERSRKLTSEYIAWQAKQDRHDDERRKKLKTDYIAWQAKQDQEAAKNAAAQLNDALSVASQIFAGNFDAVASTIGGKLKDQIVDALGKSPAVQSAMSSLGSFLTGPAGLAVGFGSLLVMGIMSASEQARLAAKQAKEDAISVDKLLHPEKYQQPSQRAQDLLDKANDLQKKLNDLIATFNMRASAESGLFGPITAGLNKALGGGSAADVKKQIDETQGLLDQVMAEWEKEAGRAAIKNAMPGMVERSGFDPSSVFKGLADTVSQALSGKQGGAAVMPGETPEKPIYTQVVNVRDFREAFPDSAYFRAPSVDTTRSLNANAVAYR